MKVLFVTSTFPRSETDDQVPWLLELALVLSEAGVNIEVLAPTYAGLPSHKIQDIPVHRYRYFNKKREIVTHEVGAMNKIANRRDLILPAFSLVMAGMAAAARLARLNKYDVIHSHWPMPMGMVAQAGRWASVSGGKKPRLAATFHGAELALAQRNPHLIPLLTALTKNMHAVIANSSHTASSVLKMTGIRPAVIPFGAPRSVVDFGHTLKAPQKEPSNKSPATGELPIVLAVGRIIERKGFPVLVRAANRLRGKARVIIAGGGEREAVVEAEIKRQRVGDVVHLAGRLTSQELTALYSRCAVFCLPAIVDSRGDTEGLGVVLIEAMSHGKPIVASRIGGIVDAVEDGETGLLVPPNDPEALADALLKLLEDPGLAVKFGGNGRGRARRLFSWERIVEQHLEVYETGTAV